MPQSHGTRRRPSASSSRTRSDRRRGRADVPVVPSPRRSPEETGASGYGAPAERPRRRRVWRALTGNVAITIAAIGALVAALVFVDFSGLTGGGRPPKMAAGGLSTNDMLARLTGSDMDPIAADAVAAAKKRAYEEHQRELKELKEKAKRDAKARAKLKAERERERLAKSNPSSAENKKYGRKMSALKGWGGCWSSLETLWDHESGWNERAVNPSSGAYGIPQALPGSKLASAGSDWRTSSPTQIAWGLGYIKARYKDPCGAWAWWSAHHWY
ncbi:lytic transglycosylase domain-containing protein [Actinomadura roseirufa]|uniref:aggregation-promoting factor C-terminal-like domain-containing protein n=1 Tax=Actinomadura roseirufa TaxID=2094049 RepID=UPI0010414D8A|nr:lytic transglycosylase domain-containing protein [Actinomadura roseirufa]